MILMVIPSGQNRMSAFLLIRHSKYSTVLSKIHSYRLLFRRFCPLGCYCSWM